MNYMLIIYSITAAFFAYLVRAYLKLRKLRALLSKLPGIQGPIFLGNIGWILKLYYFKKNELDPGVYIIDRMLGLSHIYKKYGIYSFFIGTTPIVSIHSPDMLEIVLSSNVSLEKSYEYTFLRKWLGLGLLTSTGPKWRSRRKILTPSFHFRILDDFLPSFNEQSSILVKKLQSLVNEQFIDISPLITNCTLDIVCETMMGYRIGAQQGENRDYVNAIHNLADFFNKRTITPWLWMDCTFNLSAEGRGFNKDLDVLHSFTKKVIKEKKNVMVSNPVDDFVKNDEFETKKRKSFMDLLLDLHLNGEQITEDGIQEEVDTFMFEGHDTTAMGIIYALYCIGLYPEIQKKIHEELDAIFEENSERTIIMEDVWNMKYLECVLKESQRIYPSVPLIGRMLNEDIYYKDVKIPKGTTMHCNILGLHRNPDVFPNPEVFDPARFLPENSLKRHPYGYVPFSAGPRNCIGQKFALLEEKVVVSNVLRHFKIESLDPRDKVHSIIEFTLRPAQPMRLKLLPRNN